MHGYLSYVVQTIPEICLNGANVKEYLLIVYAGIYQVDDVEKCGDIIVCPLHCFHDCVDVLSVYLHGITGDV